MVREGNRIRNGGSKRRMGVPDLSCKGLKDYLNGSRFFKNRKLPTSSLYVCLSACPYLPLLYLLPSYGLFPLYTIIAVLLDAFSFSLIFSIPLVFFFSLSIYFTFLLYLSDIFLLSLPQSQYTVGKIDIVLLRI